MWHAEKLIDQINFRALTRDQRKRRMNDAISAYEERIKNEPCPICLEDMEPDEDIASFECSHRYHRKCIDQWMQKSKTCPQCHKPLVEGKFDVEKSYTLRHGVDDKKQAVKIVLHPGDYIELRSYEIQSESGTIEIAWFDYEIWKEGQEQQEQVSKKTWETLAKMYSTPLDVIPFQVTSKLRGFFSYGEDDDTFESGAVMGVNRRLFKKMIGVMPLMFVENMFEAGSNESIFALYTKPTNSKTFQSLRPSFEVEDSVEDVAKLINAYDIFQNTKAEFSDHFSFNLDEKSVQHCRMKRLVLQYAEGEKLVHYGVEGLSDSEDDEDDDED